MLQDLRVALRALRKSPGFTAIAAVTLALGIGTNTTMFSVVQGVLLEPFPFENPDRLVVLYETMARRDIDNAAPSYQNFLDWERSATTFSSLAAVTMRSTVLGDTEEPERLLGGIVTWDLFPTLGVHPVLGRHFRQDEDRPGAPGAVLLGHGLWQRRYNGYPGIVGRVIPINGHPHTVVGVMPPGFRFPFTQDVWVPMAPVFHDVARANRGFSVFGRLQPGTTIPQADGEIAGIGRRLAEAYPEANKDWAATVRPLSEHMIDDEVTLILLTMMGAVTFVLLIACSNVANLLLARATARHREIAIRTALGAGRWRIVRQLLTESVIVALVGGVGGVLLAFWGTDLIWLGIPAESNTPYFIQWSVDGWTLLYTLSVSVVVGIVFGLAPALEATRGSLQESLKEGGRGGVSAHRHRLRSGLVVAEVALSLILLVGASLFVRSFVNAYYTSAGFDTAPLMTMRIALPHEQYPGPSTKARRVDDLIRRVEALPGVVAATASNTIPTGGGGTGGSIIIEGKPVEPGEEPSVFWTGVAGHWVRTLGVTLVAGRDFTDREVAESSGVAVIDQRMARRFWPDADPVGRRFRFARDTAIGWISVIGVITDIYNNDVDDTDREPSAYLPYPYLATLNTGLTIRVSGDDPVRVTTAVRREIRASDPSLPVFEVQTMESLRQLGFWQYKLFGWMFSVFGAVALLLAAVGVYGVLAYNVNQRTQEIGVRVALGARRRDVLGLVVGHGVRLALIGVAAGVLGALGVTRVLVSILFEVSPSDPLSYAAVALFLTGSAALASYLPARRAMAVDPMVALRYE
jgi:putative ABC transport system permease protein